MELSVLNFLSQENRIKQFMDNFEILNVYYYSLNKKRDGYIKIKVEEEIQEYDFKFGTLVYKETEKIDITKIEKFIDKKTNKKYTSYHIFKKINGMLPIEKKDNELFNDIGTNLFNEHFTFEMEKRIIAGLAEKYKEEIDIVFVQSIELKLQKEAIYFNCKMSIFERDVEFKIYKCYSFYSIQEKSDRYKNELSSWFLEKIVSSDKNKKDSLFYIGGIIEVNYPFVDIIGHIITEKFKSTTQYKMAVLYNPEFEKKFK
jgi:hypothetical protein